MEASQRTEDTRNLTFDTHHQQPNKRLSNQHSSLCSIVSNLSDTFLLAMGGKDVDDLEVVSSMMDDRGPLFTPSPIYFLNECRGHDMAA